ncbi:MAG: septum site-determining protein MinC [Candidatus Symbiodolus clandestinus]
MALPPVILKGAPFTFTVLYLQHPDASVLRPALQQKIAQAPQFLNQAPVFLNLTALPVETDWQLIIQIVREAGFKIVGLSGRYTAKQRQALQVLCLPLLTEGKLRPSPKENSPRLASQLVTQPVRSGQQIYAKQGDLIITNTVNAGAEVAADGHLHLYGVTRGRIIAGAAGDTTSRIFCNHLQAELVAIAGHYWLSEQIPQPFWQRAVMIALHNEQLTISCLDEVSLIQSNAVQRKE